MRLELLWLLLVLVTIVASQEIPTPEQINQTTRAFEFDVSSGSVTSIIIQNIENIVDIQISARKNQPSMAIQQAIKHPNQFKNSTVCKIVDPDFSFERVQSLAFNQVNQKIKQYYFSQYLSLLVVQTYTQIVVYNIANLDSSLFPPTNPLSRLALLGNIHKQGLFKQDQFERFFFELNHEIFYTNGFQVYKFVFTSNFADVQKKQNLLKQNVMTNYTAQIKQIAVIPPQTIFVLYQTDYQMFKLSPITDQFEMINYKEKPEIFQFAQGYFSDVDWKQDTLYLLNNIEGIVEIKNYHPQKHADMKQVVSYHPFKYGEHLSFQIKGKLIQIVCELNRERFVAEMYLHNRSQSLNSLDLNRFYTKIRGVTSTKLFRSQLFIFGDEEISVNGPGINRHVLQKIGNKEYPYIFSSYGISYFEIIQKDSHPLHTSLIGISQDGISILLMEKKIMSLSCKAQSQSVQILANVIAICCSQNSCEHTNQPIEKICNYQIPIDLQVSNHYHFKQALVITLAIIVTLCLISFAIMVGICKMMEVLSKKHYIMINQMQKIKSNRNQEKQQQKQEEHQSDIQLQNQFKKQKQQSE